MSKAEEGLKEAFAGESQANRKYLAFAAKADKEGYAQIARLFRAAAEAETIHAHNHLRAFSFFTAEEIETAPNTLLGILADGTGVDQDQVGTLDIPYRFIASSLKD